MSSDGGYGGSNRSDGGYAGTSGPDGGYAPSKAPPSSKPNQDPKTAADTPKSPGPPIPTNIFLRNTMLENLQKLIKGEDAKLITGVPLNSEDMKALDGRFDKGVPSVSRDMRRLRISSGSGSSINVLLGLLKGLVATDEWVILLQLDPSDIKAIVEYDLMGTKTQLVDPRLMSGNLAYTFISRNLSKKVYGLPTGFLSKSETVNVIILFPSAQLYTLAHELMGHLYLLAIGLKGGHKNLDELRIPLPDGHTMLATPQKFIDYVENLAGHAK